MPVMAFQDLCERSVLANVAEERTGFVQQRVVGPGWKGPGKVNFCGQREALQHIGKKDVVHGQFVGIQYRGVKLAFVDSGQKAQGIDVGPGGPGYPGVQLGKPDKPLLMGAVGKNDQLEPFEVGGLKGAVDPATENHQRPCLHVGRGKAEALTTAFGHGQAGRSKVRVVLVKNAEYFAQVIGNL